MTEYASDLILLDQIWFKSIHFIKLPKNGQSKNWSY